MTHEQFVWWLEGFLDGGADMDLDVRTQIREKLNEIGATPAPAVKQPEADKPKTSTTQFEDYVAGIGVGVATPGIVTPRGGWPSGGFVGAAHTLGYVDPHGSAMTMALNSTDVAGSASSVAAAMSASAAKTTP